MRLFLGAAAALSVGLNHAWAQQNASAEGIEEVVVTAQKRAERLIEVPISISVLSGEQLDQSVRDLKDVLRDVPGITAFPASNSGETRLSVRGITSLNDFFQGGSPIGYYIDGVPLGLVRSAITPDLSSYDLDRVEVLRGPQGTLYGANSANGLLRVQSRTPNMSEVEVKFRAAYYDTKEGEPSSRIDGAVNVPLIEDKLAFRGVASYQDLGGWIDRPFLKDANRGDRRLLRGIIEARPTENLTVSGKVWNQRADFLARSVGFELTRTYGGLRSEPIATDLDLYALEVSYDFGAFSATSTTSELKYFNRAELDYNYFFPTIVWPAAPTPEQLVNLTGGKSFVQEFNFASTGEGPWKWTAGAMYRDTRETFFQGRPSLARPATFFDLSESYAAFGELARSLFDDRLELLAGVRYFKDNQDLEETSRRGPIVPVTLFKRASSYKSWTPRFVATFKPSTDMTFYTSYSEGFRPGFEQNPDTLALVPGLTSVKPDLLKSYEVGSKGNVLDNVLSYDLAVYHIKWLGVQQTVTVDARALTNGVVLNAPISLNGESASAEGFEGSFTLRPFDGFQATIGYARNNLEMDGDVVQSTGTVVYRKGDRLNGSAKSTFNLASSYEFQISDEYSGLLSGSFSRTSPVYARTIAPAATTTVLASQPLSILGLRASLMSEQGWTFSVFGDNLTDEKGRIDPLSTFGSQFNGRMRPRTMGVQLEAQF